MAIEDLTIKLGIIQAGGAALGALEKRLDNMENASEEISKNFRDTVKYMKGAATAAVITKEISKNYQTAVKFAGNLEEATKGLKKELISPTKSLAQVNKELQQIESAAFSIQKVTPFDQAAIVNQAEILRKAGLEVEAISGGALEATAKLAAVEKMDPQTAASISAVADATFDLKNQAGGFLNFADLMSRATSLADFGVEDFGESLKYAGAQAKRLNLNTRETAVAIAALAKGGLKGSQGGTTFAAIFRDLESKRPDLVFDKVTGAAKPLQEILDGLNKEIEGLTDEKKSKALNKIFGEEAKKGIESLIDNQRELNNEIDKQASLQDKIDVLQEGFNEKLESLKGTTGSTIAGIFKPALEPLKQGVDLLNEFVGAIGEATQGENTLGKVVSNLSGGALLAGGATSAILGGLTIKKLLATTKVTGGLGGLLGGFKGTASGVAKGALISSITGGAVQEVFVVNAEDIAAGPSSTLANLAGNLAGNLGGGLPKGGKGGGFLKKAGGVLAKLFPSFTSKGKAVGGFFKGIGTKVLGLGKMIRIGLLKAGPVLATVGTKLVAILAGTVGTVASGAFIALGGILGGAIGLYFKDEINNFLEEKLPKISGFLDSILPKFGEARAKEKRIEEWEEQERQAELHTQEALKNRISRARAEANQADLDRFGKILASRAPNVANQIGIHVDQNGKVVAETKGPSKTTVDASFKPALD